MERNDAVINGEQPVYPDPMRGAPQDFGNQNASFLPSGLTKREYFAAVAMQGYLAMHGEQSPNRESVANASIMMADELLKAINGK
jgi:hypothetical protein